MPWNESLLGLLTALGIGLLIGTVRERLHKPGVMKAGVRTHAIVALLGAITFLLGMYAFVAALLMVGVMVALGYRQSAPNDPGMTGEFALLLTAVLSGLAIQNAPLAAATGVVVAGLLFVKKPLRHFSQEVLSEKELEDALMLCAAALVVLPLLPTEAVDPWHVLKPYAMWKIVVLIMGIGMVGHIAMRATGARWGLPLAGFFSGFISSTAAVAEFGRKATDKPELTSAASAAALFSTLSSLTLFCLVLGATSQALLRSVAWPLAAAALALVCVAVFHARKLAPDSEFQITASEHAFKVTHALLMAATISGVTLLAAGLRQMFGESGVLTTAVLVGLVELHSAVVSVAQLGVPDGVQPAFARWGVMAVLASSVVSKIGLAYLSGGKAYGHRVTSGLVALLAAALVTMNLGA